MKSGTSPMAKAQRPYRPKGTRRSSPRKDPLLPEALRLFLRERLIDCCGIALVIIALACLTALITYDQRDPSLNHATGEAPRNALGKPGAYGAAVMLESLGYAAAIPPLVLIVWGLFIFRRRHLRRWWLRVIALLVGTLLTAIWASFIPSTLFDSAGGATGDMLHQAMSDTFAPLIGGAVPFAVALISFFGSLCFLLPILGIAYSEWMDGAAYGRSLLAWSIHWGWDRRHILNRRPKIASTREPLLQEEEESPGFDSPAKAEKIRPAPKLKPPAIKRPTLRNEKPRKAPREPDFLPVEEYELPPASLLQLPVQVKSAEQDEATLQANAQMLTSVLADFGIGGEIVRVSPGPVVTLYELEPAPGIKSSRVIGLADDIARSLSAVSVRVAVVPGKNVIGIELPNARRETVYMRALLGTDEYEHGGNKLALILGKEIGGQPIIADLARMPHLLVAGTTGSGKSVAVNTMILSLLFRLAPEHCRFIMIDPKMLELSVYDGIPHLLAPVVTEPKKAVVALKWTVREMEDRYRLMSKLGVRNIDGYNARLREAKQNGETLTRKVQTGFDGETGKPVFEEQPIDLTELPYIVVVVDEFADLMLVAGKDIEAAIQRLAQMARAAGIHLIMATQRPSVDVITGTIKANFPTRISFQVTSKIDSRTILGESGAEQLLGQGDMLYMAAGGRITRVHGPFVRDSEVEQVVAFLKKQGEPDYVSSVTEGDDEFGGDGFGDGGMGGEDGGSGDELYDKAIALVARERKASTSFIQRHFQIGYNKAARLIERMEKEGIVSQANHVGRRDVLLRREDD
jgi:S-DNA-T family DNA segregation ATPase FtsK/SpoIIIE